ncbi:MAG: DUF3089 domain-containing protein [Proteobacteria bacterium]|nr:DUF3089 domain-containing protein [Pseudomonadota bacterium]MBU1451400.1 DUF3089 domain-containing protein [Pseudomonadota bacterium]MBU2468014.1 DUF3089 domain-containing protein [Pseudomonadota bacterium]MBU2517528.1 DUF3089 domain-containing protein [Pseudomonadota bacterium]
MPLKKIIAALGLALFLAAAFCLPGGIGLGTALAQEQGPDYSQVANWLYLPKTSDQKVDVFWVYPTVYNGKAMVAEVNDPQMRAGAENTLVAQAGVFKGQANIYAPLYRQASAAVLTMSQADKDRCMGMGLSDVQAAFEYYLKNYNQGRPFILAGHSQGSNLLTDLARKNLERPVFKKKMVAAYLIGWSITKDDLQKHPSFKICRSAAQTGCIVTYNSVAAGAQKSAPTILPGAISVNPLSWSTGGKLIPASQNTGAVFFDDQGKSRTIPQFTSAQNKDGGLVVEPKDPALLTDMPFGPGVYHCYDYSLFYENLRANAAQRIKAFQAATPKSN